MKICTRCVLPSTFPGIGFDDEGVCNFCKANRGIVTDTTALERVKERFEEFVKAVSGRNQLHCMMALSGGKDSTYALMLLRNVYHLKVLAVTFDHGYLSSRAIENAGRVSDALGVEHLIVRPNADSMRRVFAGVADGSAYPMVALERASSICNACMGMVKSVFLRIAVERSIPAIAYGWSPGQAPSRAAFFRMHPAMIRKMQEARVAPLLEIVGSELTTLLLDESHLEAIEEYPFSINPLAFVNYDEGAILEEITALGWEHPDDTDGNSTNCLLNQFANRNHMARFGFHPYSFEIAGLVRTGSLSRDEGLAKLADLGNEKIAQEIARSLGLKGE